METSRRHLHIRGFDRSPGRSKRSPSRGKPSWFNIPSGKMIAATVRAGPYAERPPARSFDYKTDYPKPTLPSQEWVLIRVQAVGLNRAELAGRANAPPTRSEFSIFHKEYHTELPFVLGGEFVGIVETPGYDTRFKAGDVVTGFGYGGGRAYDGAYAQYTICHQRRLFKLPFKDKSDVEEKIGWDVLASVPVGMWTAYGSLFEAGRLGSRKGTDEVVLIHGATSSVGIWATLLAKDKGFTVIGTSRQEEKLNRLKDAGADHVMLDDAMEYQVSKLFPKGVDVVLELVGPDALERTLKLTARYGTVVCAGTLSKQTEIKGFKPSSIPACRNLTYYSMNNRGASIEEEDEGLQQVEPQLEEAIRKIQSGTFRKEVFLDKIFSLEEVGQAHKYMEDNKAVGKVVLAIP